MKKNKIFFRLLLGLIMILLSFLGVYLSWTKKHQYPILQGLTDATSTRFLVVVKKQESVHCFIRSKNSGIEMQSQIESNISREFSAWGLHKCRFDGLNKESSYELSIKSKDGKTLAHRHFGLLDPQKENVKIALISCSNDWYHLPLLWKRLKQSKPDLIFLLGDNVYADVMKFFYRFDSEEELLYKRYVETWQTLDLYQMDPLIPLIAIWDDHDYGVNNGGSEFKYKNESYQIFENFFYQENIPGFFKTGPGISSVLEAFGSRFIFLDGRTFRNLQSDASYFSAEQFQWVKQMMQEKRRPTWMVSGSQWFGSPAEEETFEFNYPDSFKGFLKELERLVSNILFVSLDTHFSDIKKIPLDQFNRSAYELTSSAIHSLPLGVLTPDPRRLEGINRPNFMTVEFLTAKPLNLSVTVQGWWERPYFHYDISYGVEKEPN
jgi:alkaline phosphatase D